MIKKLLILLFVACCVWLVGFVLFDRHIGSLVAKDDIETDAIVVLTGGSNRIGAAAKLLNDRKADKLFISGVFKNTSLKELQRREDVEIFNSEQVTLDKQAKNTVENAQITSQWIKDNNIRSIYLVTSNYHLPRSVVEFEHYNRGLRIIPYPVYSGKVKQWWKNWHSFMLLAGEYNKFLYVWIKDKLLTKEN